MGIIPNPTNVAMLVGWQHLENAPNYYNPLATTLNTSGSSTFPGYSIRNYPTLSAGASATAQTLQGGNYPGIVQALQQSNPSLIPDSQVKTWNGGGVYGASDIANNTSTYGAMINNNPTALQAINTSINDSTATGKSIWSKIWNSTVYIPSVGNVPLFPSGAGKNTSGVSLPSVPNPLTGIDAIASFMTNTHNYLRVGEFLGGMFSGYLAVDFAVKGDGSSGHMALALTFGVVTYSLLYGAVKNITPVVQFEDLFGGKMVKSAAPTTLPAMPSAAPTVTGG